MAARPGCNDDHDPTMEGTLLQPLGLVALAVAMIVTLYEMGASLKPVACSECPHCRQRAAEDARKQETLAREYARRNGLDSEDDDDRGIG
jgi:hypothetical protein